ncbi:MAG: hypothetical protein K2N34_13290 [Lachnospiraceae bacterium]|nr:hypothetical protein [Lachnospiraceae bacterium]
MRNNEEIEIEEKYKELPFMTERKINLNDIKELVEWMQRLSTEMRQKKVPELACILLETFSNFCDWKNERKNQDLRKIVLLGVEILAVIAGECDAYVECVRFLYGLHKNIGQPKADVIAKKYFSFQDILPRQKGLFLLQEEDGTRVFPIHELVSNLAKDFKCDNDHLINLAVAQQMFERVEEYEEIEGYDQIKQELLTIARSNGIVFLEYLVDGGELFLDETDYRENGTLLVKRQGEVIIRNLRKSYFANYSEERIYPERNQLAWFIYEKIEDYEELVDFTTIISGEVQQDKLDVLAAVEDKKNYNIFLPMRIVRNRINHKFQRFLNLGIDYKIVYRGKAQECSRSGFLKVLSSREMRLRSKWMWKKEWDILTVDFYCAFYLMVVGQGWYLAPDLESEKEDFYQRDLMRKYLEYILESRKNEIDSVIECLYQFINTNFDYAQMNQKSSLSGRLFAFPLLSVLPEELQVRGWLELKKDEIFDEENDKWEIKELSYSSVTRKWDVDGEDLDNSDILTVDRVTLDEADIILPKSNIYVFYSRENNQIIYEEKICKLAKKLEFVNNVVIQEVIHYNSLSLYCGKELKRLVQLMLANNFSENCFEEFQCEQQEYQIFCLYKVLWHFQIFGFTEERVNKFWQLIIERHYLGCVEETEVIKQYFNTMSILMETEEGVMVLAKESSGNESTLQYLYDRFGKKKGERNFLSWSFDQGEINKHLSFEAGRKIFKWKGQPLRKVVFMVDNLMLGKSLRKMLDFHIKGIEDGDTKKRSYLRISPSVKDILEKQEELEIEIHVIFGFTNAVQEIEDEYKVRIVIYKEIPERYRADSDTVGLVNELYGKQRKGNNIGCCCIYRYNNLPFVSVLPDYIIEPKNCAGLFERKGEI